MIEFEEALPVDDKGAPVSRRIKSSRTIHTLLDDIQESMGPMLLARARIQGLIDGNPPHSQAELERLGRGFQTNVNFREAESIIDMATASAYELTIESENVARFSFLDKFKPNDTTLEYDQIVSEEYTRLIRAWSGFYKHSDMANKQTLTFGFGAMIWPNELDWRPKAFKSSAFRFPAKASTDVSENDLFMVYDEMSAKDLLDYEDAENWDKTTIRQTLKKVFIDGQSPSTDALGELETQLERLKSGDPTVESKGFRMVPVVHCLVRESGSGRVSHYLISEDPMVEGFLCKKEDRYKNMESVLWLLPFNYGDGLLRGVKGLGHRIFHHCELSNRFMGQMFDAGAISASLILQPTTAADVQDMQMIRLGPVLAIPPNVQPIQRSFAPPLEGLIQLRQVSEAVLNNNTGVFRPVSENPLRSAGEKTAAQVYAEEAKEARFEKNQATHRYHCWDRWHTQVMKRLLNPYYLFAGYDGDFNLFMEDLEVNYGGDVFLMSRRDPDFQKLPGRIEALKFLMACLSRGVPPQLLLSLNSWEIRATRSVGIGSQSLKIQALSKLFGASGRMGEKQRRNIEREWAAAELGSWDNVDRFFPKLGTDKPSNQSSIAKLENNDMDEGHEVLVGSDQLHGEHLPVHSEQLVQISQQFLQDPKSVDPAKATMMFQTRVPHMLAHLENWAGDPTREAQVEQYIAMITELKQVFSMIEQEAKGILKAQEEERQQMQQRLAEADESVLKHQERMHEIELKHQARMADVESLNQKRQAQLQVSLQTTIEKSIASIQDQQRKTEAEVQKILQKTQAEVLSKEQKMLREIREG